MCDFFDWDREDPERKEAHDSFKTALVLEFNSIYGTELDNMESWRNYTLLWTWPHYRRMLKKPERCVFPLSDLNIGLPSKSLTSHRNRWDVDGQDSPR